MPYKPKSKGIYKYNPCKSCLCLRCDCLLCKYEKFYSSYPVNAGCIYCMMHDNDIPVKECDGFRPRSVGVKYKIRFRRKNPYVSIAKLIVALHTEIKKL